VVASRKAFTLIELLVVLLILMILAGIVIVGFNVLGKPGKEKETRQMLQNLRNAMEELRISTNLANFYPQNDNSFWPRPMPAPTSRVQELSKNAAEWPVDVQKALGNTRMLMHKLRQTPKSKAALNDLPADRQLKVAAIPNRPAGETALGTLVHESPIMLDAWGGAIIIVPAEGLGGVVLGADKKVHTITSLRARTPDDTPAQGDAPLVNARPFFASAGPDGMFTTGDDNIYSFED
jgi:prepilin-type N-terminal cleavage/methylation domain-containing protein